MQAMSPCNRRVRPHGLLRSLPVAVLVLSLGLLNLSGCAGGFQGYRPGVQQLHSPRVSLFLSARPQRSVSPPQEPAPLAISGLKMESPLTVLLPVRTPRQPLSLAIQVHSLL